MNEENKKERQRTKLQNRALHKFFALLAEELNDAGYDMKKTLKPEIDIPWSKDTIKEYLWRPIQEAQLRKCSTTQLNTKEIDKIYNTLNRHIGERFGIHVPFPSINYLLEELTPGVIKNTPANMNGRCQNCGEKDQELEKVIFKDKEKQWCEMCVEGRKI